MNKRAIQTEDAPAAIGPYSQSIRVGNFLFLSGQIPIDPATGKMVPLGIEAQTRQVLQNIQAVLMAAGVNTDAVVKTMIYLTDLNDFQTVNEVYADYFEEPFPARATVQVAALPRGALVEIDAIAVLNG
jgi:2-iminobutanoate/2-iminopropanoate deaminase